MFKKYKFWLLAAIGGIALSFIMVLSQIPTVHTTVKNLPLAIVNEDPTNPISEKIVDQLKNVTSVGDKNPTTLKWTTVKSTAALKQDMSKQKFYGAIIIKRHFGENMATLATSKPTKPSVTTVINQAKNPTVGTAVTNLFSHITTTISGTISKDIITQFALQQQPIPIVIAKTIVQPLNVTNQIVHPTENKVNATAIYFQPLWLSSVIISLMLFYAAKDGQLRGQNKYRLATMQLITAASLAIFIGVMTPLYTTWPLDYHFQNFWTITLFATIAEFSFIMIILGILSWTGFIGLPLFVLLMFFALPILQLAPEMLSHFYRNSIYPWLPMRFLIDGMRGIIYYHDGIWHTPTFNLLWVMVIGMFLLIAKVFLSQTRNIIAK